MKRLVVVCGVLALCAPALAGPSSVAFTKQPAAASVGGQVRIDFAVNRETDVAVAVEDAQGKIVRHLAAGVLGKNAPAPLKPNSLAQSLVWDGKDNDGRPVAAAGTRVRVSLGLKPSLDRIIGQNLLDLGGVRALAVGPDGNLYVFHTYGQQHPNDGTTACAVFNRQGKYLRTIVPYPASLPDSALKGLRRITREDGRKVPFVYQLETRSSIPGLGDLPTQRAVVTSDGRLAFIGIHEGPRPFAQPGEARLTVINTDGSVPDDGVLKTPIVPLTDSAGGLALAPDEKTLYATGLRAGLHPNGPGPYFVCDVCDHGGSTWVHTNPIPAVFRLDWDDPQAILFVGGQRDENAGPNRLVEPVSVATDGDGNVYVADAAANEIVVFTPYARLITRLKVTEPQRVEVHRRTGEIYVLAGERERMLIKLRALPRQPKVAPPAEAENATAPESEPGAASAPAASTVPPALRVDAATITEVWRVPLAGGGSVWPTRRPIFALDDRAEPPILWIGQPFLRIEDRGATCGEPFNLRGAGQPEPAGRGAGARGGASGRGDSPPGPVKISEPSMAAVMELSLDRVHGWLYVNNSRRMNVATGQWESFRNLGGGMWPSASPGSSTGSAGRDGLYYVELGSRAAAAYRYSPSMQLMPFPEAALSPDPAKRDGRIGGYAKNRPCGLTADAQGNVYIVWKKGGAHVLPTDFQRCAGLFSYTPDGKLKKELLVDAETPYLYSPRVDRQGNIYLAVGLRPGADPLVPGLDGQVPRGPDDPGSVNRVNSYPLIYGSVVKFGPQGGVIRKGVGGMPANFGPGFPTDVKGAQWIAPGVSMCSSIAAPKKTPGTIISCVCEYPVIDVDDFGRTFYPDAGRAQIGVLDTHGNALTTFGVYGNPDSTGPEIPLWWPMAVAAGDTHAYVGDRLNRRILSVRLTYVAEATCEVK
jgi:sugar lactone lactonase YvrE